MYTYNEILIGEVALLFGCSSDRHVYIISHNICICKIRFESGKLTQFFQDSCFADVARGRPERVFVRKT